jgi:integrase
MAKRAYRKVAFTKESVTAFPTPESGRSYFYDSRQPGLALCVLASGKRAFYLSRWALGRAVKVKIGDWPQWTVESARREARKINQQLDQGTNPNAERQAKRHEPTLRDVWEDYQRVAEGKVRRKSLKNDSNLWRRLEPWATRRLSTIGRSDLEELHRGIGVDEGHPTMANRVLELAGKLFYRAMHGMDWDGRNPCRLVRNGSAGGIRRFAETKRERHLNDREGDEVKRFLAVVSAEQDEHCKAFILTAMFTGVRKSALADMRWEDLALNTGVWTIQPGEGTKSRRTMRIPLSSGLVKLLSGLEHRHPVNVFRNVRGELTGLKHGWPRIKAHFRDLHFHDLRRTTGAILATLGASDRTIKNALGHCSPTALEHYAYMQFTFPKWVNLRTIRQPILSAPDLTKAYAEAVTQTVLSCAKTTIDGVMGYEEA